MVAIDLPEYGSKPRLGGMSAVHLRDTLGCPSSETSSGFRVADQPFQVLAERQRRASRRKQAILFVADEIADATFITGDDRQAGPERLENRHPIGLLKCRPNEDVTSLENCGHVGTGQLAQETNGVACRSTEFATDRRGLLTAADDEQPPMLAWQAGNCLREQAIGFAFDVGPHHGDRHEPNGVVGITELLAKTTPRLIASARNLDV
jgi:hypothetical protein